jgi:hypothetical protein
MKELDTGEIRWTREPEWDRGTGQMSLSLSLSDLSPFGLATRRDDRLLSVGLSPFGLVILQYFSSEGTRRAFVLQDLSAPAAHRRPHLYITVDTSRVTKLLLVVTACAARANSQPLRAIDMYP